MVDSSYPYRQSALFAENQELISSKMEDHRFDRKSFRIEPKALANALVGFANGDGGTLLVGVSDSGEIEGVGSDPDHLSKLRQAAMNFTVPPVPHTPHLIACTTIEGKPEQVLAIEIPPSDQVHRNHRGEVFLRLGNENRKLDLDATLELVQDKGMSNFDGSAIRGASYSDFDASRVDSLLQRIGNSTDPRTRLKARGLLTERGEELVPTVAGVLILADDPEVFVPGAFVRVLRYDGIEPQYGQQTNASWDLRIGGSLIEQIAGAEEAVAGLVPQLIRLNESTGQFETIPSLPRSVWREAIVNAVTHRSYSQQGDHIRVILFEDRLEILSPGRLPWPVRLDNIRSTRFSRNPRIARVLADLKIVQELNEGVNRMFEEMALAGLPDPEFHQSDSGFRVTLRMSSQIAEDTPSSKWDNPVIRFIMRDLNEVGRASVSRTVAKTGFSAPTVRRHFQRLSEAGIIERVARSATDPQAFWIVRDIDIKQ